MEYLGGGHYNLSKLRSLLFFDVDTSPSSCSMSKFLGDGLRFLKVLDCRGAPLDKFPKVILKLYNLRYLSLRETQVSSVPSSIQKLKNLETLELRDTNVVELPVEILKIHGLRHILVIVYVIHLQHHVRPLVLKHHQELKHCRVCKVFASLKQVKVLLLV